jgi:hypothetical protein
MTSSSFSRPSAAPSVQSSASRQSRKSSARQSAGNYDHQDRATSNQLRPSADVSRRLSRHSVHNSSTASSRVANPVCVTESAIDTEIFAGHCIRRAHAAHIRFHQRPPANSPQNSIAELFLSVGWSPLVVKLIGEAPLGPCAPSPRLHLRQQCPS